MIDTRTIEIYDTVSERYDRSHRRWLRYAGGEAQCAFEGAASALLHPGISVLDAACGTGTTARRLIRHVRGDMELVLLDASRKMLRKCEDISAIHTFGCMTDLPFESDRFDLLTCAWGLETLADPQTALNEFIRVTKSGGHICLVFCADRPSRSILASVLRGCVSWSGRGRFLQVEDVIAQAGLAGATRVYTLHNEGPASALILHV